MLCETIEKRMAELTAQTFDVEAARDRLAVAAYLISRRRRRVTDADCDRALSAVFRSLQPARASDLITDESGAARLDVLAELEIHGLVRSRPDTRGRGVRLYSPTRAGSQRALRAALRSSS